jgi:DNA replication protein DnaC
MSTSYERVQSHLQELKLNRTAVLLDGYLERSTKEKIPLVDSLDFLLKEEICYKNDNSLLMRTKLAGFPYQKTFEQFDFKFQPSIDGATINELRTMRFVHQLENVILLGPPGVGKTHLSISIGLEAIRNKFSTYYLNCHDLITSLNQAQFENKLNDRLKNLCKYKLLVIDEVGYLPIDKQGANLFFQLISKRYEKGSIILSSNKSYNQWDEVFGDASAAILDRLLHHSTTINIKGDSYRVKDRKNQISINSKK